MSKAGTTDRQNTARSGSVALFTIWMARFSKQGIYDLLTFAQNCEQARSFLDTDLMFVDTIRLAAHRNQDSSNCARRRRGDRRFIKFLLRAVND